MRCRGEYYAVCNSFQHDQFRGRLLMVLEGISLEGRANLYRLYADDLALKTLDPLAEPMLIQQGHSMLFT